MGKSAHSPISGALSTPAHCSLALRGAPGGPLLSSPPPHQRACFWLLSGLLFHPCSRGLQGLREHLGPAPPPPHSSCLPWGRGDSLLGPARSMPCLLGLNPPFPLTQSLPATLASWRFLQSMTHAPASGPLHRLFPPPERLFSQVPARLGTFFRPEFKRRLLGFQAFPD